MFDPQFVENLFERQPLPVQSALNCPHTQTREFGDLLNREPTIGMKLLLLGLVLAVDIVSSPNSVDKDCLYVGLIRKHLWHLRITPACDFSQNFYPWALNSIKYMRRLCPQIVQI